MSPGTPLNNVAKSLLGDAVLPRKIAPALPGGAASTYVDHARFNQGRHGRQTPLGATLSSLVRHVIGVGSEEEMIGPDAGAVIALVQNEQAAGDRAAVYLPGQPVGSDMPLPVSRHGHRGDASVSLPVSNPVVLPAFPYKHHGVPQALNKGHGRLARNPGPHGRHFTTGTRS